MKVLGSGTLSQSERDAPLPGFTNISTMTLKPKCCLPSLLPSIQPPHPVNHHPQSSQLVNTSATSFSSKTFSMPSHPEGLSYSSSLSNCYSTTTKLSPQSLTYPYIMLLHWSQPLPPSLCLSITHAHIPCSFHTHRAIYATIIHGLYHMSHTLLPFKNLFSRATTPPTTSPSLISTKAILLPHISLDNFTWPNLPQLRLK